MLERCERCRLILRADGTCEECDAKPPEEGVVFDEPSFGWISIDPSTMGSDRDKVLQQVLQHWSFLYECARQRQLPQQEIPLDAKTMFVVLGAKQTYAYLRRMIEPDFRLPVEWIKFEPLDDEAVDRVIMAQS